MWYAVQVFTGQEVVIADRINRYMDIAIQKAQFEDIVIEPIRKIFVAVRQTLRLGHEARVRLECLTPSYIFIHVDGRLTGRTWHTINNTPGVLGIVNMGTQHIPEDEMEVLFKASNARDVEIPLNKPLDSKVTEQFEATTVKKHNKFIITLPFAKLRKDFAAAIRQCRQHSIAHVTAKLFAVARKRRRL